MRFSSVTGCLHMTDPENKGRYKNGSVSENASGTALDFSPVRAICSPNGAASILVPCWYRQWRFPMGNGCFTLASVSLPYADDVPVKIKKRVLATIAGGLASVLIYSFIPWPAGHTAAMMISGYISFYFYRLCTDLCLFHRRGDRRGSIYACLRAAGCGQHVPDQIGILIGAS